MQIIGTILAPLPPDLPMSPPVSRRSSPVLSHLDASTSKRKLEDSTFAADVPAADGSKRTKSHKHQASVNGALTPASTSSASASTLPSPSPAHYTVHTPASTLEATAASAASHGPQTRPGVAAAQPLDGPAPLPTPHMPVRRPRRGKATLQEFDRLHDVYHTRGRAYKYSGDARFWSTYPSSHKHFKPLNHPPSPGTPYHTYGGLMSRLELVDALLHFVYSLWVQDFARNRCASTLR